MELIVSWMQQHTVLMLAVMSILVYSFWIQNFRKKLNMGWLAVIVISLLHCVIGLLTTRILAIIEVGGDISKAANMRLFGAVFFLPIFYGLGAKIFKRDYAIVFDMAAVTLVIGFIFGRIDCLLGGCCDGTLIPGSNSLHWPIREVELLYYAAFLIYYCNRVLHGRTHGEVYSVFMIQYGLLRFLLEWFRVEFTTRIGVFHLAHIWCIISVLVGLSIYFELQSEHKSQKVSHPNSRKKNNVRR